MSILPAIKRPNRFNEIAAAPQYLPAGSVVVKVASHPVSA